MKQMRSALALVDRTIEAMILAIFVALVAVGSMQVFGRYVLNQSLSWSEEFLRYAHIWIVYLAIPVGYRRSAHIGMETVIRKFPVRLQRVLAYGIDVLWLAFALLVARYTLVVMRVASRQRSPGLGMQMSYAYLALFVGMTYLAICVLRRIFLDRSPSRAPQGDAPEGEPA